LQGNVLEAVSTQPSQPRALQSGGAVPGYHRGTPLRPPQRLPPSTGEGRGTKRNPRPRRPCASYSHPFLHRATV